MYLIRSFFIHCFKSVLLKDLLAGLLILQISSPNLKCTQHNKCEVLSLFAQSEVCLSLQCGSSKAAERRHGDLHWQHKGPGLQQQGSAFHSTLLSAYPLTTSLIVQLVATRAEKWL